MLLIPPAPWPYTPKSGEYQPPSNQLATAASAATNLSVMFSPFDVGPNAVAYNQIAISVSTAVVGGTTPLMRLGVYLDDGTGAAPGALLLDAGNVTITATGIQGVTIALTLQPGRYWVASFYSHAAAPTTALAIMGITSAVALPGATWTNSYRVRTLAGMTAGQALPASGSGATGSVNNTASVALRAA